MTSGRPPAPNGASLDSPAVLFILPWEPSAAGGVNSVVLSLVDGFGRAGAYRPLLLVNRYPCRHVECRTHLDRPGFYEYFLPPPLSAGRPLSSLLSYLIRLPITVWRFIAFIRRHHVRTVDLHYPGPSAFTVLLARFMSFGAFNVVLSFHGADVPRGENFVQRVIWQFILRCSDAIVACSQALADELRAVDATIAVHVVHNAIDAAASRSKASRSPLPEGLEGRRYILSVGKFEHKKAHDILMESFERIAASQPDLYLAIVGASGPRLGACQARAAASPFRERMLLYRDVPHGSTLAAIAHARLLVLPSRQEPFGLVILEAAAMGTPVIASNIGGIPEIIQDGYNGVLVRPDDSEALSAALRRELGDPQRANAYAARMRESVIERFSLAAQVRSYQQVFDSSRHCTATRPA